MTGVVLGVEMRGAYANQPGCSEIDCFLQPNRLELFNIKPACCHRAAKGNYDYRLVDIFVVHPSSPAISKHVWEIDTVYFRNPRKLPQHSDVVGN